MENMMVTESGMMVKLSSYTGFGRMGILKPEFSLKKINSFMKEI
jgi:hypothetical protein